MLDIARAAKKNISTNPTVKQRKSLSDMLLDSAIIGGITFFAAWTGSDTENYLIAAKAFGAAFVLQLAIERGLRK